MTNAPTAGNVDQSGAPTTDPRIRRLDLETRVRLCSGADAWHLEAVDSVGLSAIMVADGPHGLRKQIDHGSGGGFLEGLPATCFPTAAGLAASWDRDLVREVGAAIGREALAAQVAVVLGPGANIKRHPLCGRNFEYFSEDPLLSGDMAAALIEGVQSTGVGTAIKHFAANNQEARRMVLDVVVDERTLREIYLAGFERAVTLAKPWTVMCAYNKINGTYASENRWLLTDILRDEWGFDGLVMTDWGAANDRVAGLTAGLDLEMPGSGGTHDATIIQAVRSGDLEPQLVDLAASRVLHLADRGTRAHTGRSVVDADEHHRLARSAAAKTAVLLTNDGILPLSPLDSVAVIGEFAVSPRYQGAGSSAVTPTRLDCALDAFVAAAPGPGLVRYARGYAAGSDERRQDLIDEAVQIARSASVAVVFAGLPPSHESEAYDRDHLRLPEQHNELIRSIVDANPDTVVVLSNGAPVQMPWVDKPRAIVEGYLGGQASGSGIVDVLHGTVNPSAKLAETFPVRQSDLAADTWFPGTGRQVQYREGIFVGYRWFDIAGIDVLFPFGHGLSYTTFGYADLAATPTTLDAEDPGFEVSVSVTVTNTGPLLGTEVVQLYVRDEISHVHRPDRELKAFDTIELQPGATGVVRFTLDRRAFAYWDTALASWQVEPGTFEVLIGASSRDIRARTSLDLTSTSETRPGRPAIDPARPPSRETFADDAGFEALLGRPLPPVEPARPFHRNSTVAEVAQHPLGSLLAKALRKLMTRALGSGGDPTAAHLVTRMLDDMPLRSIAALSGGRITMGTVDRIAAALNISTRRRR